MIDKNTQSLHLNQGNLQDFLDCPRRFELHSIQDAIWPAAASEPPSRFEELTDLGIQFHSLCQQFFIGIDPECIQNAISNPELRDLWDRFLPYGESLLSYPYFSEQMLRYPFRGHILVAKYDYIASLPGEGLLIIDWKTAPNKPDREQILSRAQTFLYPYILHHCYRDLFGETHPAPEQIKFQFWYPLSANPAEEFIYSESELILAEEKITALVTRLEEYLSAAVEFPLTDNLEHCKYCLFRSFCERGLGAPSSDPIQQIEKEDLSNTFFDLNSIEEIEF